MCKPQIHGHRGARGLFPENSLPGFAAAIEWGIDGIEMDVCVSADGVLVLSHDLYLNPDFSRDAAGNWLQTPTCAIHTLSLKELRKINIGAAKPGSRYAGHWPLQRRLRSASIPTLNEVVELARRKCAESLLFNIELKSDPYRPDLTPPLEEYARLFLDEVRRLGIGGRLFLQSFDWNLLAALRARQPAMQPGYLTSRQSNLNTLDSVDSFPSRWTAQYNVKDYGGSIPKLVAAAGGRIWSSNYLDLTANNIEEARTLELEIYAWTVNGDTTMRRLSAAGVAAITTDYPQQALRVLRRK